MTEATEESKQMRWRLNIERVTPPSNGDHVFRPDRVEKMKESFKLAINACSVQVSSRKLSPQARNVVDETLDKASKSVKTKKIQDDILDLFRDEHELMGDLDTLGKEMVDLNASSKKNKKCRLVAWVFKHLPDATDTVPWYTRFVNALSKLCKQLMKLTAKAIGVIVDGIRVCFNVVKAIAEKIFRAVKACLLWLRHSIVDPQGEIYKILENSETSSIEKAADVIRVVATAIIGALILSAGISMDQITSCGLVTAAGVAVVAAIRNLSPRNRERLRLE